MGRKRYFSSHFDLKTSDRLGISALFMNSGIIKPLFYQKDNFDSLFLSDEKIAAFFFLADQPERFGTVQ
jgi:hypothetical protein